MSNLGVFFLPNSSRVQNNQGGYNQGVLLMKVSDTLKLSKVSDTLELCDTMMGSMPP